MVQLVTMTSPWKHPQTGVYYLRKGVPKELRSVIGKGEIKQSLKTKDPKEAKKALIKELPKIEALFDRARSKSITYTTKLSLALAGKWLHSALEKDDEYREQIGNPPADEYNQFDDTNPYEVDMDILRASSSVDALKGWLLEDIQTTLNDLNLPLPTEGTTDYLNLIQAFKNAKLDYLQVIQRRALGNWKVSSFSHKYPPLPESIAQSHSLEESAPLKKVRGTTLEELLKKYKKEGLITKKTENEYKASLAVFKGLIGEVPIEGLTIDHIRKYRDHLSQQDLAGGTKTKKLGAVKSLLNYALNSGVIDSNPAAGIKIRTKETPLGARLPFSEKDIQTIFTSKVFMQGYRPKAGGGEAAFWLPYLAYYTGARLEELGQLHLEDIQKAEGVEFIEFSTQWDTQNSTRSIKTKAGWRIVPLHPKLISLGFLDYVESLQRKKAKRLFPNLPFDKQGDCTQNWSKWWNQRYLRQELGITDKRKTFHSFRHTFVEGCRLRKISEDIQNSLVGHAGDKKVSLNYGRWLSPRGGTYAFGPRALLSELAKVHSEDR